MSSVNREFENALKSRMPVFIGIIAIYAVLYILRIGCPIKFITGISCAGCGMTRAWIHVLRFEFTEAMSFHPLFWIVPPAGILLLCKEKLPRNIVRVLLGSMIVIFITVYIVRMLNPEDIVVEINFYESFIWKIIKRVRDLL